MRGEREGERQWGWKREIERCRKRGREGEIVEAEEGKKEKERG